MAKPSTTPQHIPITEGATEAGPHQFGDTTYAWNDLTASGDRTHTFPTRYLEDGASAGNDTFPNIAETFYLDGTTNNSNEPGKYVNFESGNNSSHRYLYYDLDASPTVEMRFELEVSDGTNTATHIQTTARNIVTVQNGSNKAKLQALTYPQSGTSQRVELTYEGPSDTENDAPAFGVMYSIEGVLDWAARPFIRTPGVIAGTVSAGDRLTLQDASTGECEWA